MNQEAGEKGESKVQSSSQNEIDKKIKKFGMGLHSPCVYVAEFEARTNTKDIENGASSSSESGSNGKKSPYVEVGKTLIMSMRQKTQDIADGITKSLRGKSKDKDGKDSKEDIEEQQEEQDGRE